MSPQSGTPSALSGNTIREIPVEECLQLLAASTIGRVAWCTPNGPQIIPVNIRVHEGTVVFRTAAYSALAQAVHGATVAVEVDEINDATRSGWSVVAVGAAEAVSEPSELSGMWSGVWQRGGPDPWAPGVRTLFIRVTPRSMTGRRIESA
jgi:nitroimidazol reductase NimA-like FMN-containing flavoprotein (pyridoxamine 5'-phosphate oxidase superfamily)